MQQANNDQQKTGDEKVFELTIRNGAGKRLQSLMEYYEISDEKVIALSLALLDRVKDSKIILEKPDGSTANLSIQPQKDEPKKSQ